MSIEATDIESSAPDVNLRTAVSPDEAAYSGEQIDEYRLIEVVGEGGMGIIYKAEQRGALRRIVALKVIKLGMDTRAVIARFEAERQALAMMSHPSIARVYDAGSTPLGRPYFVMEFVSGEPITSYCDRRKLTIRERMALFEKVCDAVQHAHTKGIIHRDLKASNVLVTEVDGQPIPKIIDFGVAKATNQRLTEQTLYTEQGRLVGTPAYMSPEQAAGSADVDTRTDVYALGVLLYELLTGSLPFDPIRLRVAAYPEMQRIIREDEPPRPSTLYSEATQVSRLAAEKRAATFDELADTLRHELEWIPLMAMRKERSERYETAAQLRIDVENYLTGRPLLAAPDSRGYRLRKLIRRHRGPFVAAAAVLLALLLGLAGTTWQAWEARQAERETGRKAEEALAAQRLAQANQAKAERNLDRANDLLDFVEEIFWGMHPEVGQGQTVTLNQAVERAQGEMGSRLSDPAARARFAHLLGSLYLILGNTARAGPLIEEGVAGARDLYETAERSGTLAENDYEAVINLVTGLVRQSQYQASRGDSRGQLRSAQEAYDIAQAHLPADEVWRAWSAVTLATAGLANNALATARPPLEEALAFMRQHPDRFNAKQRATILNNLGVQLAGEGNYAAAEEAYDEAAWVCEEANQVSTDTYARVRLNQGILAFKLRKWDIALACLQDATTLQDALRPDTPHLDRVDLYDIYARLLTRAGDHDMAAEYYRRIYEILRQKAPDDYARLCDYARLYAHATLRADHPEQARTIAQESLHWLSLLPPNPGDPSMARRGPKARMVIGEAMVASGESSAGVDMLRQVLADLEHADRVHPHRRNPPPDGGQALRMSRLNVALAQSALAGALIGALQAQAGAATTVLEEARTLLIEAEQALRAVREDPAIDVEDEWRTTVRRLVALHEARGDAQQAGQWREMLEAR